MRRDRRRIQPFGLEQPLHRVEAVEPAGIEGAAQEPAAIGGIADPALPRGEIVEGGVPAGHFGARGKARRGVEEAHPFAGHRILVPAGEVEGPVRHRRKVGRRGHEAVIAVDHHPRALGPGQRGQPVDPFEHPARIELYLAGEDQVEPSALGGRHQTFQWHRGQLDPTGFGPAQRLAAERVELAVAGQHPRAIHRQGRDDPDQEIVGVGREGDAGRIGQAQLGGDVALGLGDHFGEDLVPLVVGQQRGIVPGLHLSIETGIGPQVMAVRGKVQPSGRGIEGAGKQVLEAHSAVRSDHSSGKARLPSVDCR